MVPIHCFQTYVSLLLLKGLASCQSFVEWLKEFTEECKSDQEHKYMCEILLKILQILTGDTDSDQHYFELVACITILIISYYIIQWHFSCTIIIPCDVCDETVEGPIVRFLFLSPSGLLQDLAGRGWQIPSEEQDAHEFFHVVMTTLFEEHHHVISAKPHFLELFQIQGI